MTRKIIRDLQGLEIAYKGLQKIVEKEAIVLDVEKLSHQRSSKQLRSYWLLISIVRNYFVDNGHTEYTLDMISDFFKIRAGLFTEINGVKIPKSISNKNHITRMEMEKLINTIIEFGAEFGIDNCYLDDGEISAILKEYEM